MRGHALKHQSGADLASMAEGKRREPPRGHDRVFRIGAQDHRVSHAVALFYFGDIFSDASTTPAPSMPKVKGVWIG